MSAVYEPTDADARIIRRLMRRGESEADVLRQGLRALERQRWEDQARQDMERIAASGEDLSLEPDEWGFDGEGNRVDLRLENDWVGARESEQAPQQELFDIAEAATAAASAPAEDRDPVPHRRKTDHERWLAPTPASAVRDLLKFYEGEGIVQRVAPRLPAEVLDPTAGSGLFLAHTLEAVQREAELLASVATSQLAAFDQRGVRLHLQDVQNTVDIPKVRFRFPLHSGGSTTVTASTHQFTPTPAANWKLQHLRALRRRAANR
ncbi:hypothetical protein ACWCQK_25370 [Streptomyces sp. NPDC002306]